MPRQDTYKILSETALLEKVSQRDEQAFDELYHRYAKKVYLYAQNILKDNQAAQEVMQEVMLKLWLLEKEINQIKNLDGYIRILSRNKALNELRKQKTGIQIKTTLLNQYSETDDQTQEKILLNDTKKILQEGIAQLPKQQKAVYELCHIEGLKYEEAAEKLQLSSLTVATHMKHALKFLREHLRKNADIASAILILKLLH